MDPLSVMVKPVGSRCNMRCAYCYYLEKGRFSSHEKQTRMSYGLLEKLIRQTVAASEGPVVSFTWHGGEPTLAGLDFYRRAVALEKKYLPRGWEAWNSLQTNALLLNDAWCRFLRENRFDVGVSIDGSRATHDANRREPGGAGTWDRVRRSLARLRGAGLDPDLLCTVNAVSAAAPDAVYDALRDLGSTWLQFIPIAVRDGEGNLTPESVEPERYGAFLCRVFDRWTREDLGRIDVQLFAECARVLAGGEAGLCWMRPTCGRALIAEEDGAIYSCDHFVDEAHRLGTLERDALSALSESPFQREFGASKRGTLTAQCRRCPWLALCGGGCMKDRFALSEDGEAGHNSLCPGLTMFFSHAVPVLKRIMKMSGEGRGPEEIRALLESGS